ncbi:MAG: hypothetical protein Q4P08_05050 [Eubacteriales bacterium]|nr:hypothetical protein [Eubacteriales bacterium]
MAKKVLISIISITTLTLLLSSCAKGELSQISDKISSENSLSQEQSQDCASESTTADFEDNRDNILSSKTDSNLMRSRNDFREKIEITNGSLFFNKCIPSINDIAYFNPDTAQTEKWDLEEVREYLGTSFYPSYVPQSLKLCTDPYSGTFISEYIDEAMHWTVAFEGAEDSLVYDNFGLFYSDSLTDEYNPLRKTLYIEVSKNKIPESDTLYLYETTEKSKISNTELRIGFYKAPYYEGKKEPAGYTECFVAEFMIDNVGYRVRSENLSQTDFIRVLTSLPVFQ